MRVKTLGMLPRPNVITVPARGMRGVAPDAGPITAFFATPDDITPPPRDGVPYSTRHLSFTRRANLAWSMATNPMLWLVGTFATGWIGGYLAWVVIGRRRGRR